MIQTPIDDHEVRRALADVLDLAPSADAARRGGPMPTAGERRRLLIPAAAAVIAVAGATAIAVVAVDDRAAAPAAPPPSDSSAPAVTSVTPTEPAQLGWPPLFTLGPYWQLDFFNQTGPLNGDFEFHSTIADADTEWHVRGSEHASDMMPGSGVVHGQWLPAGISNVVYSDGHAGALEGAPTTFAGSPARVFYHADQRRFVVVVELPEGEVELYVRSNSRAEVQAIIDSAVALDPRAFAATLPDSVIQPGRYGDVVDELLGDTPLPDSFDPTDLVDRQTYTDRIALVNELYVRVSCSWLRELYDANDSDPDAFAAAATALETHMTWAVAAESTAPDELLLYWLDPSGDGLGASYGYTLPLPWSAVELQFGCAARIVAPMPAPPSADMTGPTD